MTIQTRHPAQQTSMRGFLERERCPVCDAAGRRQLYAGDYTASPIRDYLDMFYRHQGGVDIAALQGLQFVLDRCLGCELVYQRYVPGDEVAYQLYEVWIDPQKALANRPAETGFRFFDDLSRQITAIIRHFDREPRELELLDFGMGWGDWCHMARAFGCAASGMDLSPARIAHAKARGIPVLAWDDLSIRRFDFINAEQVFEHLTDPVAVLRHLAGALKPGGLLRICVPDGHDIEQRLKAADWMAGPDSPKSLMSVAPLEHINTFSYRSLVDLAAAAGLVETRLRPSRRSRDAILGLTLRDVAQPVRRAARWLRTGRRAGGTELVFERGTPG